MEITSTMTLEEAFVTAEALAFYRKLMEWTKNARHSTDEERETATHTLAVIDRLHLGNLIDV